jgi:N-acetylglucosamine-6-sulfatase
MKGRLLGAASVLTALAVVGGAAALAPPHRDGGATRAVEREVDARPNIVVVMADDMRADDLVFTPRVRRLIGAHGTTFANSFSPFPLCCPARASFLTGEFAHNHGVLWHNKPYGYGAFDDSQTIATSLRDAGYGTAYVGKYLNRYGPDRSKVSGTPSWRYVPRGWDDWRATIDANRHVRGGTYNYRNTPYNVNGRVVSHPEEYQTDVTGAYARQMVTRLARRDRPFFAMVNFLAPHVGGPVEKDDVNQVRDDRGKLQEYLTPARPAWVRGRLDRMVTRGSGMPKGGGPSEKRIEDQPTTFSRLPEPNARERAALTNVTRQRGESMLVMDREIGRLVSRLKRLGEWDDTVLVFTSDNGYYLGEHRHRTGKVFGHEPSFRVPLLVTGPGLRAERTSYDPISTVDLTATLLDLAGAAAPHPADGRSLRPTLYGADAGWSVPMLYEAIYTDSLKVARTGRDPRSSIGVRTARWSYIRDRGGQDMLYDLATDPLQNRNLAGKPAYAATQASLDTVWEALKDCAGADCQVPLPDSLAATPAVASQLGAAYWKRVTRVYGFDPRRMGTRP